MKKIREFFMNKNFIFVVSLLAFIAIATSAVFYSINVAVDAFLLVMFSLIAIPTLFVGVGALTKNHAMMKTMLAVSTSALVIFLASYINGWVVGDGFEYLTVDQGVIGHFNLVIDCVICFIVLLAFINHLIIASKKGKNSQMILFNQVLLFVLVPFIIAQIVLNTLMITNNFVMVYLQVIMLYIGIIMVMATLVGADRRLKAERVKDEIEKTKLINAVEKIKAEKLVTKKKAKTVTNKKI